MTTAPAQRGIALDMDGVIVDGMPFHVAAWQHAFRAFGMEAPGEWFLLYEGIISGEVMELVLGRLGKTLSDADRKELYALKLRHFDEIYQIVPIPGISALTETLHEFGYPVVVVTGSERPVALNVLDTLQLHHLVQEVISGSDVTRGKPAPDPYLKAVEMMGVDAAHCLVVENAPPGIAAAKAAHLTCIAVQTTLDSAALQAADFVKPTLDDVTAMLRQEHARSGGVGAWLF